MNICYFNHQFIDKNFAKVSVTDRGFLFSDGVYEVIPVYNNKPFLIHEHLERLHQGLKAIRINFEAHQLFSVCNDLIEKNKPTKKFNIYIQITRGEQERRDHRFNEIKSPTVLVNLSPCQYPENYSSTHKALLKKDIRWLNCSVKSISLLPNVLYRQLAEEAGCIEAIMYNDKGITEASASNVWMVKGKTIFTTPSSENILNGITRMFLIESLKKHNLNVVEKVFTQSELVNADEVWVTSSTKEIQPIVSVNENIIADGKIGEYYNKAINIFNKEKQLYYDEKKYL